MTTSAYRESAGPPLQQPRRSRRWLAYALCFMVGGYAGGATSRTLGAAAYGCAARPDEPPPCHDALLAPDDRCDVGATSEVTAQGKLHCACITNRIVKIN